MVVLIKNAEVYEPRFLGKQDILILGDKIAAIGKISRQSLTALSMWKPSTVLILPQFPALLTAMNTLWAAEAKADFIQEPRKQYSPD